MGKKVVRITESDLVRIVKRVIEEQDYRPESQFTRAVQQFLNQKIKANLNVDGLMGDKTQDAIMKYQSMIGTDSDGRWGRMTWEKMPETDRRILKKMIANEGGLIDKFLNWMGIE
jgi:hypothetical protein